MDAMRDAIDDALLGSGIQVEGRMVVNPTATCVDIYPGDPSRDAEYTAFGDVYGALTFNVRVRTNTGDSYAGQEELLNLMDDEHDWSIAAALADDPTLGGMASGMHFPDPTGFMLFPTASGDGVLIGFLMRVLVVPVRS